METAATINLRPAGRSDIPALARIANAANARSMLHKRMAPFQDQYPADYYQWRLNIVRQRFATANLRTVVAEDPFTKNILGQASWAVEGTDTPLHKRWALESSTVDWLESKLLWIEGLWNRYFINKSVDYEFLDNFMSAFQGADHSKRPACLHLHLIVVDPQVQSKGIGRSLIDWGKKLAVEENLPLFMEATLEAPGFYEKGGFLRLSQDVVVRPEGQEPISLPLFAWEGSERAGRWLEEDGTSIGPDTRWKWKEETLPV